MDLREMMQVYQEDGLAVDLASARVCQDIVLMAIANGPFNRNVTIKGGVVMRSITDNNRRAIMLIYNGLKTDFMADTEKDVLETKFYDATKNMGWLVHVRPALSNSYKGYYQLNSMKLKVSEMLSKIGL